MNKKANTFLFMLFATLFCTFVTVVAFMALLIIYSKFFFPIVPEGMIPWVMPVIFILSIITSFLVYRIAIKVFTKKVNIEKNFDPIFRKRR